MNSTLQNAIHQRLRGATGVVVLSIGSWMRADDAAGLIVGEEVLRLLETRTAGPRMAAYIGETAPENFTSEIKRFAPSHLVLVDAADVGKQPGHVEILESDVLNGNVSFSTHSLPVRVLVDYVRRFITCDVFIIGIQPASSEFAGDVTPEVTKASKQVAAMLTSAGQ